MTTTKITIPDMGDFKDVEVIEVLVKKGQTVKKNDSLITLESDKSSVEVPSTHEGKINEVKVSVGDKVNQGDIILTLETKSSSNETKEKKVVQQKPKSQKIIKQSTIEKQAPAPVVSLSGKSSASPNVRKFARELGADISKIPGTQRSGRVSNADVKKFIRSQVTVDQGQIQKKESSKHIEEYKHEEFGEIKIEELPRVKNYLDPIL